MVSRRKVIRLAKRAALLAAGFVVWMAIVAPLTEAGRGRITVYRVRELADGRTVALPREKYRVWPNSRSVHREYPDRQEYRDCEIADRRNWSCSLPTELAVTDGRMKTSDAAAAANGVRQVSRFAWHRAFLLRR